MQRVASQRKAADEHTNQVWWTMANDKDKKKKLDETTTIDLDKVRLIDLYDVDPDKNDPSKTDQGASPENIEKHLSDEDKS